jgi:hypothetical protein
VAKGDGINLAVDPRHIKSAVEATKASIARSKRLGEARVRKPKPKVPQAPFKRSGGAVHDLASALGYPPAVIPKLKPSNVHVAFPDEPDEEGSAAVRKLPRKTAGIYRVVDGVDERQCARCKEWLQLQPNYRWRTDRAKGMWSSECKVCEASRRRDYYERMRN